MSILNKTKQELIAEFAKDKKDSGSTEVQCAILTQKIANLTEHLKSHKKDNSSKRGLLIMVSKRRKLLDYLKKKNEKSYQDLIKSLNIRK
jgi:small subunit ribosomal protein S15